MAKANPFAKFQAKAKGKMKPAAPPFGKGAPPVAAPKGNPFAKMKK